MGQRIVFDLTLHGEEQLARAVRRMPPGCAITLMGSRLTLEAVPGAARRFTLRPPPGLDITLAVDPHKLNSHSQAATEFLNAHRQILASQST